MKRFISILLTIFLVMTSSYSANAAVGSSIPIQPMAALGWVNTYKCYYEKNWELAVTDYNSYNVDETTSFSATVRAKTAAEAISNVTAGLSGTLYGVTANANAGSSLKVNGEITWEYTVSGSQRTTYRQYEDLYKEYLYEYYIYQLVDTNGKVYDTDYKGKFLTKTPTGNTMLVKTRKVAI